MDHAPNWDWSALASEFLAHSVEFDRRSGGTPATVPSVENGTATARDANPSNIAR